MLEALQHYQKDEPDEAEQQHGPGVALPVHAVVGFDARDAVDAAFDGPDHGIQEHRLALEDPAHVLAHGLGQQDQKPEEKSELKKRIGRHWNFSGINSAMLR